MQFLEYLNIGNNWIISGVIYALLAVLAVVVIRNYSRISLFVGEVRGELRKASWPWESDPKIKGFKKYKELIDSTTVVLIAMVLLAGFVQFWDFVDVQVVSKVVSFFTGLGQ